MAFISRYVAHQPDSQGYIQYSEAEHHVWTQLFERQMKLLPGRASDEFLQGLETLALVSDRIPQREPLSDGLDRLAGCIG